jgi:peptidoglycan/LPS O-acetylase OafA/YrhL
MSARRIDSLTAMRGLAALGITLYHACLAFAPDSRLTMWTRGLPVCVSFFFVLSGFVLTWSWDPDRSRSAYWRDRLARILPLYVCSWLLAIATLSWLNWAPSTGEMIASLLLLQAWIPGDNFALRVNAPSWSLSCEVAFYAALPFVASRVLSPSRKHLRGWVLGASAAWIAGGVACVYAPISWWPPARAGEFLAGVVLAATLRDGWRPGPVWRAAALAAVGGLIVVGVAGVALPVSIQTLLAAPAIILLIAQAAIRRGRDHGRTLLLERSGFRLLGQWSYSLYLSHWLVVLVLSRFLIGSQWIILGIGASIAVAAALHLVVERPSHARLRTPTDRVSKDNGSAMEMATR